MNIPNFLVLKSDRKILKTMIYS